MMENVPLTHLATPLATQTMTQATVQAMVQASILEQALATNSRTMSHQYSALTPTMGSQALMELMMICLNGETTPGTKFASLAPSIMELTTLVSPGMVPTTTL